MEHVASAAAHFRSSRTPSYTCAQPASDYVSHGDAFAADVFSLGLVLYQLCCGDRAAWWPNSIDQGDTTAITGALAQAAVFDQWVQDDPPGRLVPLFVAAWPDAPRTAPQRPSCLRRCLRLHRPASPPPATRSLPWCSSGTAGYCTILARRARSTCRRSRRIAATSAGSAIVCLTVTGGPSPSQP